MTRNYREAYGLFACNGILFNHESPRRGETFVTRKITMAVARIAAGLQDELWMGNLDAARDWGYAKEYVEAMWLMLQADEPDDFVVATGHPLHGAGLPADLAFEHAGLDWEKHVRFDERYLRPTEVDDLIGDASKAARGSAGSRRPSRPTWHGSWSTPTGRCSAREDGAHHGRVGQDGAYLARLLLGQGYRVMGTITGHPGDQTDSWRPTWLEWMSASWTSPIAMDCASCWTPSGPTRSTTSPPISSVAQSWSAALAGRPRSTGSPLLGLLEEIRALRDSGYEPRMCQASSSEMFGRPRAPPE